mgnify:CR=1 FL=1
MKLFGSFEAIKFPEENLFLITCGKYIYYIYSPRSNFWRKYKNAGNDSVTTSNYPDVSIEDLRNAMNGRFPQKETDFMRMCNPSQLCIRDFLALLLEDYPTYMSDCTIHYAVHEFLLKSNIPYKTYERLRDLFRDSSLHNQNEDQVVAKIKALVFAILGRDIFKNEIGIVDGHDGSSYFWFMPVRVIDYTDTNNYDNVAEMTSVEISIEENDVDQYLTPFLFKHFDDELKANKSRIDFYSSDNDETVGINDFEWNLTHNFYTHHSMADILKDIRDTIDALASGKETEFTKALKIKRGHETYELLYSKELSKEQIKEYNANRPSEDHTETSLLIDFYQRFIYRMEYMMKVGQEKGYDLISVMGP